ncbi:MAG: hypothetical protein JWM73_2046 [Solirubrobacterales bacterium]|nr:hypothetical protein [Solirubrobacterales bacterium]
MQTRSRTSRARWHKATRRGLATVAGAALLAVPVVALAAAPTVVTSPPDTTLLTDTYAVISGVVNPKGTATNYHFEWGTTTDYGQTTPSTSASNGTADVPVDVSLDALAPSTTYHYRLVAGPSTPKDPANPEYVYGGDVAFTTAPSLALFVIGGKTAVKANRAQVSVQCDGPVDEVCAGRVTLRAKIGGKRQSIGSAGYSVAVDATKTVAVYLNPAARKALKASRTHHLLADATAKTRGSKTTGTNKLILAG